MRLNVKNIVEALTYLKSEINTLLAGKADVGHDHDCRYYTESEMNTLLNDKAGKNIATTTSDGLMSSSDKTKLDGVEAGANKTTVDSSLSATSTNPVQNKIVKSALDGKSNTGHNHDERYYTESEINAEVSRLEGLIDGVAGFSAVEVSTLPSEGANGVLYLVPKSGTGNDVHDEYVWVESSESFELVGNTSVNLSNYYTQSQTNTLLEGKSPTGHNHDDRYYTESEINTKLNSKANSTHNHDDRYYTESEIDTKLNTKAGTSVATTSTNGLMSSTDKTKLNALSNITVDTGLSSSSTNPVQNKTVTNALTSKLEILGAGKITATQNDITGDIAFIKAQGVNVRLLFISNINLRFTSTTGKDLTTAYPISDEKIPLDDFVIFTNWRIINGLNGSQALFLVEKDGTVKLRLQGSLHTNTVYGEATYIGWG